MSLNVHHQQLLPLAYSLTRAFRLIPPQLHIMVAMKFATLVAAALTLEGWVGHPECLSFLERKVTHHFVSFSPHRLLFLEQFAMGLRNAYLFALLIRVLVARKVQNMLT